MYCDIYGICADATEVVSSVAGVSLSTTEDSDSLNSQASAGKAREAILGNEYTVLY